MESPERNLMIAFLTGLAVVVGLASLALRQPARRTPVVNVEDLPISRDQAVYGPDWAACEAAGGTPQWERVSQCIQDASVQDACGFLVPCFFAGGSGGMSCNDAKAAWCACESDAQCPKGYECPKNGDRCVQTS